MSVIKSKRSTSSAQFLDTARDLHIYTLKTCTNQKRFPKKYTFFITQDIVKTASNIHTLVKKGNSIFPSCVRDVEMRREYFVQASAELQSLISQIGVAYETFPIRDKTMTTWLGKIHEEIKLLKSVIKADEERYKNIK